MSKARPRTEAAESLHYVLIDLIDVGDQMVRHDPNDDGIIEFAADVAKRGLLQPIGVEPDGKGRYQLLWGSRRLAAHVRLHRTTILARFSHTEAGGVKAVALVENLQRKQMTLMEEVNAVAHLHNREGKSPDQIADLCSKGRSWVLRRLAVLTLPPELGEALSEGAISLGAAEAIALLTDDSARRYLLSQTIHTGLNITQIRGMVETFQTTPSITEAVEAGAAVAAGHQAAQKIFLACNTCQRPTEPAVLRVIRICESCAVVLEHPVIAGAFAGSETAVTEIGEKPH